MKWEMGVSGVLLPWSFKLDYIKTFFVYEWINDREAIIFILLSPPPEIIFFTINSDPTPVLWVL